jgi:hypothetical protein
VKTKKEAAVSGRVLNSAGSYGYVENDKSEEWKLKLLMSPFNPTLQNLNFGGIG